MKVIKQTYLSNVPLIKSSVDNDNFAYKPFEPLPKRFSMYICGSPASGKTSLWTSLLLSHPTKKNTKTPRYYYKFFESINIISGSLATLPIKKFGLPENQLHNKYSDELLQDIIEDIREDDNYNSLIVLDDTIRDLTRSKILTSVILNRRHITQNPSECDMASLSLIITSQKFNLLPLSLRCNMSHIIVFKTTNNAELNAIKNELMCDLNPQQQDEILDLAWSEPYSFLFIDVFAPKDRRYYKKFDLIEID
jgi:hypothetical protein